jgi:Xaa-Pro aminopeptidase
MGLYAEVPVEEGMVIRSEFPYAELGVGGFQIEYILLVEKDGYKKRYPHTGELVVR